MESQFMDESLESYSDAQLQDFIQKSPSLPGHSGIILLSQKTLVKCDYPENAKDAIKAAEVACLLGVRTPRIKRTVFFDNAAWYIMERIDAITLESTWPRLSWLKSFMLALQLRYFIRILRSAQSSTLGSFATGKCRSFWLGDKYCLPINSNTGDVQAFIDFWASFVSLRQEAKKTPAQHAQHPPRQHTMTPITTFVFTHHDLAPRNILLDHSGQIWIIDWDFAGWYPVYFEYASMTSVSALKEWNSLAKWRWRLFVWIAAGFYGKEEEILQKNQSKFTRFSAGRRFNIMAGGYASFSERALDP